MKKILSLIVLSALFLVACASQITVATPEEVKAYPESKGIMQAWQAMLDSVEKEDCETFQSYARKSVGMEEGNCEEAFAYLQTPIQVDWSRTEWDATGGKGKIYKLEKGGITGFILNTSDGIWRFDSPFWLN